MNMRSNRNRFIMLGILFLILISWEVYVETIAPYAVLKIIAGYEIDKIFHVLGGIFISGVVLTFRPATSLTTVLLITLFSSVFIESLEFFLDAEVSDFYSKERRLWLEDTIKDIIAGIIGSFLYWKFRK